MVETITIDKATFDYLFACEKILHACIVYDRHVTDIEKERINAMYKESSEATAKRVAEINERLEKLAEEIKKTNEGAKNG